jgi:two-component system LytT family response regulator
MQTTENMIRAVIIDDEANARKIIKSLIHESFPSIEVVGEASSVESAYKLIHELTPDLVLLDIALGDGTGFDLLQKCEELFFQIIFITAYNDYAIKAFRFSALDYITKPIDPDDFENAMAKVINKKADKDYLPKLEVFLNNISQDIKKVVLNSAGAIHIVTISEIIHCESSGNYTFIYVAGKEKITVARTLKEFDTLFSGYNFFRIHQSHLINLRYLSSFQKKTREAVLSNNTRLPVSIRSLDRLLNAIENL